MPPRREPSQDPFSPIVTIAYCACIVRNRFKIILGSRDPVWERASSIEAWTMSQWPINRLRLRGTVRTAPLADTARMNPWRSADRNSHLFRRVWTRELGISLKTGPMWAAWKRYGPAGAATWSPASSNRSFREPLIWVIWNLVEGLSLFFSKRRSNCSVLRRFRIRGG